MTMRRLPRLSQKHVDRLVREVGDLSALARAPAQAREPGMNDAERLFAAALAERHPGATMRRHGWPDFLIKDQGRCFAVEVKHAGDPVRENQAEMFSTLESAGIRVFVWHTAEPFRLIPWRNYLPQMRQKKLRRVLPQGVAPVPQFSE